VGPDIDVETYWDGKLRVFRLPDGTEIRKTGGMDNSPSRFLRDERGLSEFNLSSREILPPSKTVRRR
jgi:hypothetical protein